MFTVSKNWLLTKLSGDHEAKSIKSSLIFGELSARGFNELCLLELRHVPFDERPEKIPTISSLLKVYQGVDKVNELRVPDPVCSITTLNVSVGNSIMQDLAVAAGPNIYIYRKLRPYFKFKLPVSEPNEEERNAWHRAKEDNLTAKELWTMLNDLRQRAVRLTSRSVRFLQLPSAELTAFYEQYRELVLEHQTVATCMEPLHRQQASPDSVHCLVVGTEQNCLYLIDPTAFVLLTKIQTPAAPVHLCVAGSYDIQFRISVACRDGVVYQAKKGSVSVQRLFDPCSQIVAMVRSEKSIVVGCMDQTVKGYSLKGHPMWTVRHNTPILTLAAIVLPAQNICGYVLSLADGTLQLYKEQHVCDQILTWELSSKLNGIAERGDDLAASAEESLPSALPTAWTPSRFPDPVVACVFGRYDREAGALAIATRSGALLLLFVKRSAVFAPSGVIPLDSHARSEADSTELPKKTQALSASVKRERMNCATMNRQFLADLYTVKRMVAKTYLELLDTRVGPISSAPSRWPLTMNTQVRGTGPRFILFVELVQTGIASDHKEGLSLIFKFDDTVYQMEKPFMPLPYVVPYVKYRFTCSIDAIRDTRISDTIQIFLLALGLSHPILSIFVKLPPYDPVTGSS